MRINYTHEAYCDELSFLLENLKTEKNICNDLKYLCYKVEEAIQNCKENKYFEIQSLVHIYNRNYFYNCAPYFFSNLANDIEMYFDDMLFKLIGKDENIASNLIEQIKIKKELHENLINFICNKYEDDFKYDLVYFQNDDFKAIYYKKEDIAIDLTNVKLIENFIEEYKISKKHF